MLDGDAPNNLWNFFEKYNGLYPKSSAIDLILLSVETRLHKALHSLTFAENSFNEIPDIFLNICDNQAGE